VLGEAQNEIYYIRKPEISRYFIVSSLCKFIHSLQASWHGIWLIDDVNYDGSGLQVPFLEDPNTGIEMFESAEIIDYIRATYTL
jgi:hypothetical protein